MSASALIVVILPLIVVILPVLSQRWSAGQSKCDKNYLQDGAHAEAPKQEFFEIGQVIANLETGQLIFSKCCLLAKLTF